MFDPEQEPSNYPTFNTPDEIADDLGALGFDVVSLANNHMLDVGSAGLLRTIERLDKVSGVTRVGAYKDQADHGRRPGAGEKRAAYCGGRLHLRDKRPLSLGKCEDPLSHRGKRSAHSWKRRRLRRISPLFLFTGGRNTGSIFPIPSAPLPRCSPNAAPT